MQKLNYRIWSNEYDCVIYKHDLDLLYDSYYDGVESNTINDFFSFMDNREYIVMEGSGILDSNQREIFEGDTIHLVDSELGEQIGVVEKYYGSLMLSTPFNRTPLFVFIDDINVDTKVASGITITGLALAKEKDSLKEIIESLKAGIETVKTCKSLFYNKLDERIKALEDSVDYLGIENKNLDPYFIQDKQDIYNNISCYDETLTELIDVLLIVNNFVLRRAKEFRKDLELNPSVIYKGTIKNITGMDLMNMINEDIEHLESVYDSLCVDLV